MDRLAAIIEYQWRAHWRQFLHAGKSTNGNRGITLVVTGLILIKYFRWLSTARIEVAQGNTALLSWLLAGVFVACVSVCLTSPRDNRSLSQLRRLPLSISDLFAIRIALTLITPFSWLVLAGALAIVYPLAQASRPFAGIIAAMFFIVLSWSMGLVLSSLLTSRVWRRALFAGLLLGGASAVYMLQGNRPRMLANFSGPQSLVTQAATGKSPLASIAILFGLAALSLLAARWSFSRIVTSTTGRSSDRRAHSFLFHLPGRLSALAAKDFRYSLRLLDPYVGVLVSALGCLYLFVSAAPSVTAAMVAVLIIFVPNAPLAFNSFGLETRAGMDRYALLPARGTTIIRSKNLAFAMIAGLQLLPLILFSAWRLGLLTSLFALVEAASLAIAYLTWGNGMSVFLPSKTHFYRFAPATNAIPEIIAGVVISSVPGILILYLIRVYGERTIWGAIPILLACMLLYLLATNLSGRRFELHCERIRDSLV